MSYFSVKNDKIMYGGKRSTSSALKQKMMGGGNIVYDMYKDDTLFIPRGVNVSNRPLSMFGQVVNVAPKEINKASVNAIAESVQQKTLISKLKQTDTSKIKVFDQNATGHNILLDDNDSEVMSKYDTSPIYGFIAYDELDKYISENKRVNISTSKDDNDIKISVEFKTFSDALNRLNEYYYIHIDENNNYNLIYKKGVNVNIVKPIIKEIRENYKKIKEKKLNKRQSLTKPLPKRKPKTQINEEKNEVILIDRRGVLLSKYQKLEQKLKKNDKYKKLLEGINLDSNDIEKELEQLESIEEIEKIDQLDELYNLLKEFYKDIPTTLSKINQIRNSDFSTDKKIKDLGIVSLLSDGEYNEIDKIINALYNDKYTYDKNKDLIDTVYESLSYYNFNKPDFNETLKIRQAFHDLNKQMDDKSRAVAVAAFRNTQKDNSTFYVNLNTLEDEAKRKNIHEVKNVITAIEKYKLEKSEESFNEAMRLLDKYSSNCVKELKNKGFTISDNPFKNGGFGSIFMAKNKDKDVIIKLQKIDSKKNKYAFSNEIKVLDLLRKNTDVVKHIDSWECDEYKNEMGYIVLDKWDGDVHTLIKNNDLSKGDLEKIKNIITDFHKNNFIHNDLWPRNILYKGSGNNRKFALTDFGFTYAPYGETFDKKTINKDDDEDLIKLSQLYDWYHFLVNMGCQKNEEIEEIKSVQKDLECIKKLQTNSKFKSFVNHIVSVFKNYNGDIEEILNGNTELTGQQFYPPNDKFIWLVKHYQTNCEINLGKRGYKLLKKGINKQGGFGIIKEYYKGILNYIVKIFEFKDKKNGNLGFQIKNNFADETGMFKKLSKNEKTKKLIVKPIDSFYCIENGVENGIIIMEKKNGDFQDIITRKITKKDDINEIIKLIEDFHNADYVHLDLKPANILYQSFGVFNPSRNYVLTDFGTTISVEDKTDKVKEAYKLIDWYYLIFIIKTLLNKENKTTKSIEFYQNDKIYGELFKYVIEKIRKTTVLDELKKIINLDNNLTVNIKSSGIVKFIEEFQSGTNLYNLFEGKVEELKRKGINNVDINQLEKEFNETKNDLRINNDEIKKEKLNNIAKKLSNIEQIRVKLIDDINKSNLVSSNKNALIKSIKDGKTSIKGNINRFLGELFINDVLKICKELDKTCEVENKRATIGTLTFENVCKKELTDIIKGKDLLNFNDYNKIIECIISIKSEIESLKRKYNGEKEKLLELVNKDRYNHQNEKLTCNELRDILSKKKISTEKQEDKDDDKDKVIGQIEEKINEIGKQNVDKTYIDTFNSYKTNKSTTKIEVFESFLENLDRKYQKEIIKILSDEKRDINYFGINKPNIDDCTKKLAKLKYEKKNNKVGEGDYGVVTELCHTFDECSEKKYNYVVKTQNLTDFDGMKEVVENEIKINKDLAESGLAIPFIETFNCEINGNKHTMIIMEKWDGTLEKFAKKIPEKNIEQLIKQLEGIHTKDYIHNDIKSDNILYKKKGDNDYDFKIIDFGLAEKKYIKKNNKYDEYDKYKQKLFEYKKVFDFYNLYIAINDFNNAFDENIKDNTYNKKILDKFHKIGDNGCLIEQDIYLVNFETADLRGIFEKDVNQLLFSQKIKEEREEKTLQFGEKLKEISLNNISIKFLMELLKEYIGINDVKIYKTFTDKFDNFIKTAEYIIQNLKNTNLTNEKMIEKIFEINLKEKCEKLDTSCSQDVLPYCKKALTKNFLAKSLDIVNNFDQVLHILNEFLKGLDELKIKNMNKKEELAKKIITDNTPYETMIDYMLLSCKDLEDKIQSIPSIRWNGYNTNEKINAINNMFGLAIESKIINQKPSGDLENKTEDELLDIYYKLILIIYNTNNPNNPFKKDNPSNDQKLQFINTYDLWIQQKMQKGGKRMNKIKKNKIETYYY